MLGQKEPFYQNLDVDYSLCLVIGSTNCRQHSLLDTVAMAVDGGVTMVQLREKNIAEAEHIATGLELQKLLAPRGVPLIVNDSIRVARAVGAAGVHLGQDDAHPASARAQLGADAIIGLSITRLGDLARLDEDVDYIGVGPVFTTPTKSDAGAGIGVERLRMLCSEVDLPVVAIGGINSGNIAQILRARVSGVAVVSAITAAVDPRAAAQELTDALSSLHAVAGYHQ